MHLASKIIYTPHLRLFDLFRFFIPPSFIAILRPPDKSVDLKIISHFSLPKCLKIISHFSLPKGVVCAQGNRLNETVLLCTHNTSFN